MHSSSEEEVGHVLGTASFDHLRESHSQLALTLDDAPGPKYREADYAISSGRVADCVPLGCLLRVGWLGLADRQIEDVMLGIVVGVVKNDWANLQIY